MNGNSDPHGICVYPVSHTNRGHNQRFEECDSSHRAIHLRFLTNL